MVTPSQIALIAALLVVGPAMALAEKGYGGICADNKKNFLETDVDCGGGICPLCGPGKICKKDKDCLSNKCLGNRCALGPTCSNNITDTNEADVDCGGIASGCVACCYGQKCSVDSDCASNSCVESRCAEANYCAGRIFSELYGGDLQLRTFGGKKAEISQKPIVCGQCVCKTCPSPPSPPPPPSPTLSG